MAEKSSAVYADIAKRTDGSIYIGVVGPVRTGKSTFIKKFMETLVLPKIPGEFRKARATDELPQSAAGKTIMTTEPKFIPEEAAEISPAEGVKLKVRLIDCVGYIVPSSIGYFENDAPRMVMTPWYNEEIPFNMAAEIGTQKVITEHSTIGVVVTSDGSFTEIPRPEYEEAEERVINELKKIDKPFAVVLNCADPDTKAAHQLRDRLQEKYGVPVAAVNCLKMGEEEILEILGLMLNEFPVREVGLDLPGWLVGLEKEHPVRCAVMACIRDFAGNLKKMGDIETELGRLSGTDYVENVFRGETDLGKGSTSVAIVLPQKLFYKILEEKTGLGITGEDGLLPCMVELAAVKQKYERIKGALDQVEATGYGIVMPTMEELSLQEPEIMRRGGKYGIRLRASAPSIHMMRADITTEVSPIVGSEKQSEELVTYLLKEFEEDPTKIWQSNIFGKSLHELVNEGLRNKLSRMPQEARLRLQETIERIINEGCSGLICIIL